MWGFHSFCFFIVQIKAAEYSKFDLSRILFYHTLETDGGLQRNSRAGRRLGIFLIIYAQDIEGHLLGVSLVNASSFLECQIINLIVRSRCIGAQGR